MQDELKQDTTSVALIQRDITYIQKDIGEIKDLIKEQSQSFVTHEKLAEVEKLNEGRFEQLERSTNFWKWASPTLSAVVSAVMVFFIMSYFQQLQAIHTLQK